MCRFGEVVKIDSGGIYQYIQPSDPKLPVEEYILSDSLKFRDEIGYWAVKDQVSICDDIIGFYLVKNLRRQTEAQFLRMDQL